MLKLPITIYLNNCSDINIATEFLFYIVTNTLNICTTEIVVKMALLLYYISSDAYWTQKAKQSRLENINLVFLADEFAVGAVGFVEYIISYL